MEELSFRNHYGDTLYGNKWVIDNPQKILIIVTGMAEHSARYDDFAKFLNTNGIAVYSLDHYGQGKNNGDMNPGKDYFFKMQETVKEFAAILKEQFDLPLYLLAHSMGSFVTQGYIEKYSNTIDKVVIMGTNGPTPLFKMGKALTSICVTKKNYNEKAGFLHSLSLGAYEKTVKGEASQNAWISYNKDNVTKYDADPLCGVKPTNGFYKEFMKGLASIQNPKNVSKIRKDLPILLIAGKDDPVGNNGKGVTKLLKLYSKYNLNVQMILYENMKHEILNEKDNLKVYKDILNFFDN